MTGPIKAIGGTHSALTEKVLQGAHDALGKSGSDISFDERMSGAVKDLANAQQNSASLARAYELGAETDLAKVMVAQEISSIGFQLVLNVRNKVLSAYKDIMNMPV
jgi:flagellar hook-basal body complex protein FliE